MTGVRHIRLQPTRSLPFATAGAVRARYFPNNGTNAPTMRLAFSNRQCRSPRRSRENNRQPASQERNHQAALLRILQEQDDQGG